MYPEEMDKLSLRCLYRTMRFALDEKEQEVDRFWQGVFAICTSNLKWSGAGAKDKKLPLSYLYDRSKAGTSGGTLETLRKKLKKGKLRSLKRKRRNNA